MRPRPLAIWERWCKLSVRNVSARRLLLWRSCSLSCPRSDTASLLLEWWCCEPRRGTRAQRAYPCGFLHVASEQSGGRTWSALRNSPLELRLWSCGSSRLRISRTRTTETRKCAEAPVREAEAQARCERLARVARAQRNIGFQRSSRTAGGPPIETHRLEFRPGTQDHVGMEASPSDVKNWKQKGAPNGVQAPELKPQ